MEDGFAAPIDTMKDKSVWVEDSEFTECMNCEAAFGLVTRRHHCRACGGVFCNKCSDKKRTLPHLGVTTMERVCDACFVSMKEDHPIGKSKTMLGEIFNVDEKGYPIKPQPYGVWDENGVLWNNSSVGKLVNTYDDSVHTVYDIVQQTLAAHPQRRAVGVRELIKRDWVASDPKQPDRKFEKLTLGEFSWMNYAQWGERITNFGSGMMAFGALQPKDRVLIYAETQRDWMTAALASYEHNLTVVTAYATLGAEGAAFAINQTKATLVVADSKLLKVLLKVHKTCPSLKHIITMESMDAATKEKLEEDGVQVCTLDHACKMGAANPVAHTPPTSTDKAVIMFTSGTTGKPKGVIIPHSCIVSAMTGLDHLIGAMFTERDVYVAYLPLAHIMEMVTEVSQIRMGASIGYGTPHTLTNTGVKLAEGQVGDLVVLKPTIVVFAPLVLEKIYNSIQARIAKSGKFKRLLFDMALNAGYKNFDQGIIGAPNFWNKLVFKKIQEIAGGNVRSIVTGSAPLDGNVHKFVQTCFGCPVRQGYGATETSAASFVQEIKDNTTGSVGPPRIGCCMKLVDWAEGNYRTSDKDDPKIGKPRGEIVLGGGVVTDGYLIDPDDPDPELDEKNRTEFTTDENGVRWFHTGDIGQVDSNGCLQIIDRKKDLVKLQQGEYVALSKVEGVLKLSPYVDNAMVHASSEQSYCTVLVCPAVPELVKFGKEKGLGEDAEALCKEAACAAEVLKSCKEVSKGKLVNFEIPTKVHLVPPSQTWTPENDLLTAAMKLKRKPICNFHKDDIDALYA